MSPTGSTVLVVDDEPTLLRLVQRVLERAGYEVLVAQDAEAGLGAWERSGGSVGAAVVDLHLRPRGSAPMLRSLLERAPELGVVVTSGAAIDAPTRELLRGCHGEFLRKPFAPETLLRALGQVLPASAPARS